MIKSIEKQLDECRSGLRKANHRSDNFRKQLLEENTLRLEAERQVGELREQLASGWENTFGPDYDGGSSGGDGKNSALLPVRSGHCRCGRLVDRPSEVKALQTRLDTAMGFIRRVAAPHSCGCVPCTGDCTSKLSLEIIIDEMRGDAQAILNTTSTEGKDHA